MVYEPFYYYSEYNKKMNDMPIIVVWDDHWDQKKWKGAYSK